jgi:hypothetical protein
MYPLAAILAVVGAAKPKWRVADNALPSLLLDALKNDARMISPRSLWVDLTEKPTHPPFLSQQSEFVVGRAVKMLYDIAFSETVPASFRPVGAEVWVQTRGGLDGELVLNQESTPLLKSIDAQRSNSMNRSDTFYLFANQACHRTLIRTSASPSPRAR